MIDRRVAGELELSTRRARLQSESDYVRQPLPPATGTYRASSRRFPRISKIYRFIRDLLG